ncbi:MAG: protein translocase subunit SecF [Candidatus Pacebacteria bacterium]|nr:protein translocase subunit SecF [Candidatus Paceibacterota bacterium]
MFIIKYKKIFFATAILLVLGSVGALVWKGFVLGVDFTGGSVLEVSYPNRPSIDVIKSTVMPIRPDARIQELGTNGVVVRTEPIDQVVKANILSALTIDGQVPTEKRFNTIGPSIGSELRAKALLSIIIVSLAIILFIAFAFRGVSQSANGEQNKLSLSSWKYGLVAIVVLVHDVLIPAGVFALLGLQVDTLFVVGLLTILGISVNDTIVVFDRIRENLQVNETKKLHHSFETIVGDSIEQTFTRSLMTSVTVLLALAALWVWGPESTRNLSIAMFLGMFFGTYSSIFIASPLLVVWEKWQNKNK